ncbi:hypothetical protein H9638_04430 [Arthrobacter sp. Sa2BUA2]|uniref:Tetratricopeptide repeat protein n=1 Tax=Arthrobacter pullicola TaxID=2762224 RepID=A0ABR8YFR0_9MICC|nr:hypothetical protein [Arthrobacter pullicola]MBD8043054.1 hypothetical protein [Arthrobacter pullicola]
MALSADDFILNEYKARQLWEQREYDAAMAHTRRAADTAASRGDDDGWWRMTYLLAECQRELGLIDDYVETAKMLEGHSIALREPELAAKAKALKSAGLRSLGQLPEALEIAREAALDFPETGYGSRGKLEAQQVLMAVLAESGHLEDAWHESVVLAGMVDQGTAPDKAGRAYWSIGNVAFLLGRNNEATHYHRLAADSLSLSHDVSLWALFNKASAFMRLTANLMEPETLQCIERAEMAISISGGNRQDELDIMIIRAHWRYLTGEVAAAREQMAKVMEDAGSLSPLSEGDARLLYARILNDDGAANAALMQARASVELFDAAGAVMRADQSRKFLEEQSLVGGCTDESQT